MYLQPFARDHIPAPVLPQGFSCVTYRTGDGYRWDDISVSVGHFSDYAKAVHQFTFDFLPDLKGCEKRMFFIRDDEKDLYVATATAWYRELDGQMCGMLHWVSCRPEYQRLGLGRAVVTYAVKALIALHPFDPIYLDTGTGNWRAVCLYQSLGFRAVPDPKDPQKLVNAVETLRNFMPEEQLRIFEKSLPGR